MTILSVMMPFGKTADVASALPCDPALPGSELFRQPQQFRAAVARMLEKSLGADAQLLECQVAVRRHVPGKRGIYELSLNIAHNASPRIEHRKMVAKIFGLEQGVKLHETLCELGRRGFSSGRFLVPQPLAYDPEWQLLLLGWADGELLRARLLDRADASRQVEEAAQWLLKFHQCGVQGGRRYTFGEQMNALADQKFWLARACGEAERRMEKLLSRIADRGLRLTGWMPGPTHRDFSPDHLVFDTGLVTCLDFDEFCQYDPLFDVAHFIAHLRLLGLQNFGSLEHFDSLIDRFQKTYQAGSRDFYEPRMQVYLAISYFKLAHITGVVRQAALWKEQVALLLSEAEQVFC